MSDEWNLHDAVEDGIRDNAGHLALAGALFAHSQRQKQLQALEASRQHQAQIAKTEAERLEIEKQRLELERLKQQAEKEEKEAVRLLRVMMAEVGAEFDGLSSRGQLKGSPQGVRRDYAMAVLVSKLALIRSRSNSLSDLNDLKELSRLENASQELLDQHFSGRDPLQIARSKWREIETWMAATERFEAEVKKACGGVPDSKAVNLPSKADLAEKRRHLEDLLMQLPARLEAHLTRLPADAVADGSVFPELVEQAQVEDLCEGKRTNRAMSFTSRWRMVATLKRQQELGMLVASDFQPDLLGDLQAAINRMFDLQVREAAHEADILALEAALKEGRLEEAEVHAKKLEVIRFSGLRYQSIWNLQILREELNYLPLLKRGNVLSRLKDIRLRYTCFDNNTILGQSVYLHQKRAEKEKNKSLISGVLTLGLTALGDKLEDRTSQKSIHRNADRKRFILESKFNAEEMLSSFMASNGTDIIDLDSRAKMQMIFVMPGAFTMGSATYEEGRSKNENQVEVEIIKPFWMAKTQLTQAQWESVMNSNPSHFKGPNLPVESVTWEDAQVYLGKLNKKGILPEGWKFALPTEAQWEYACRAGGEGPYSGGRLDDMAWYDGNSGNQTHEVGQKKPNKWGLHDMYGNVWEWCADWFDERLKGGSDPSGPTSGKLRVCRGGSWNSGAPRCRAANRDWRAPGRRYYGLGFRLAIVRVK